MTVQTINRVVFKQCLKELSDVFDEYLEEFGTSDMNNVPKGVYKLVSMRLVSELESETEWSTESAVQYQNIQTKELFLFERSFISLLSEFDKSEFEDMIEDGWAGDGVLTISDYLAENYGNKFSKFTSTYEKKFHDLEDKVYTGKNGRLVTGRFEQGYSSTHKVRYTHDDVKQIIEQSLAIYTKYLKLKNTEDVHRELSNFLYVRKQTKDSKPEVFLSKSVVTEDTIKPIGTAIILYKKKVYTKKELAFWMYQKLNEPKR